MSGEPEVRKLNFVASFAVRSRFESEETFIQWAERQLAHLITLSTQSPSMCGRSASADTLLTIWHGDLMRQFLAGISNCPTALSAALLAVAMAPSSPDVALSDASGSGALTSEAPPTPACGSNELELHEPLADSEPGCVTAQGTPVEIAEARAYLIETASPGYTMTLQGAELAIGRLHPEFAVRLEHAIREARSVGLPSAGVFSAYRPPAFGVGGFSDKFNSLHTYGLAVDMRGIGDPGSPEAQLWHQIAAKNGVVCPYGPRDHAEWNHCQPTSVKIISAQNPLRETVSSAGPFDLESMFEAGNRMIEDMASAADSLSRAAPTPVRALEANASGLKPIPHLAASRRTKRNAAAAAQRVAAKSVAHAKPNSPAARQRVAAKSEPHAKPGRREGRAPTVAIEEARRKSKSGAGVALNRRAHRAAARET